MYIPLETFGRPFEHQNTDNIYFMLGMNQNAYYNHAFRTDRAVPGISTAISAAVCRWLSESLQHDIDSFYDIYRQTMKDGMTGGVERLNQAATALAVAYPCARCADSLHEASRLAGIAASVVMTEAEGFVPEDVRRDAVNGARALAEACWTARRTEDQDQALAVLAENGIKTDYREKEISGFLKGEKELDADGNVINGLDVFPTNTRDILAGVATAIRGSRDTEDAMRRAVVLGGNSAYMADAAGALATALYGGIGDRLEKQINPLMSSEYLNVFNTFEKVMQTRDRNTERRVDIIESEAIDPEKRRTAYSLDNLADLVNNDGKRRVFVVHPMAPQEITDYIHSRYGADADIITSDDTTLRRQKENELIRTGNAGNTHTLNCIFVKGSLVTANYEEKLISNLAAQTKVPETFSILNYRGERTFVAELNPALREIIKDTYGANVDIIEPDELGSRLKAIAADQSGFYALRQPDILTLDGVAVEEAERGRRFVNLIGEIVSERTGLETDLRPDELTDKEYKDIINGFKIGNVNQVNTRETKYYIRTVKEDGKTRHYIDRNHMEELGRMEKAIAAVKALLPSPEHTEITQKDYDSLDEETRKVIKKKPDFLRTDLSSNTFHHLPKEEQEKFRFIRYQGAWLAPMEPYMTKHFVDYKKKTVSDVFNNTKTSNLASHEKRENREKLKKMVFEASIVQKDLAKKMGLPDAPEGMQYRFENGFHVTTTPTGLTMYEGMRKAGGYTVNENGRIIMKEPEYADGEYLEGAIKRRRYFNQSGASSYEVLRNVILDEENDLGEMDIETRRNEQERLASGEERTRVENGTILTRDLGKASDPVIEGKEIYRIEEKLNPPKEITRTTKRNPFDATDNGIPFFRYDVPKDDKTVLVFECSPICSQNNKTAVKEFGVNPNENVYNAWGSAGRMAYGLGARNKTGEPKSLSMKEIHENFERLNNIAKTYGEKTFCINTHNVEMATFSGYTGKEILKTVADIPFQPNICFSREWAEELDAVKYGKDRNIEQELVSGDKEKPTVYIMGRSNLSVNELKERILKHGIDVVASVYDLNTEKTKRMQPKTLEKILEEDCDCGLVDFSKEILVRDEKMIGQNGYVDYEKVMESKGFKNAVSRINAGLKQEYKILLLTSAGDFMDYGLGCIGRYLNNNGYDVRYVTRTNRLESHETILNRAMEEYHQTPGIDSCVKETYRQLNKETGFNPTLFKKAMEAGEKYKNERQLKREMYKAMGATTVRKHAKSY